MQSRPKQTAKASGWYFCIHCYPVLLSEEGWVKITPWKAVHGSPRAGREPMCQPSQREQHSRVWALHLAAGAGLTGGHIRHHCPIRASHLCLHLCLFQVQCTSWVHRAAQRNCWAHLQIYCCHWKYTSCTGTNCCWGTEVKAVFSGKRGSEVGSGAMLVCLEKIGLVWDEYFPFLI